MGNRDQLYNDPEEVFRIGMSALQASLWTAIPGKVVAVNLLKNTVDVQPTIQGSITDEYGKVTYVNLPILGDVPICFQNAGGFVLTFPVAVGNEALVILASRCIDAWWQLGGIQKPMEDRMHDLSDGFAFIGPRSLPNAIPNISATSVQLRNMAGTTYVEIDALSKINLVSPAGISVQGPLAVTGAITLTGAVGVTGAIVATGEVTGNAIPLSTHHHGGVATGTSLTGGPTP
jgi:hypothetical protein